MNKLAAVLGYTDKTLIEALQTIHETMDVHAHDVTVLGDLAHKTAQLKHSLRLDPSDTTSYELYTALRQRVVDDNVRIARTLDIRHENAVSEATPRIIKAISAEYATTQCFVPKASVLKKIIKHHPPKRIMTALHYRSVDSMLKHESPSRIVALARYIEAAEWQKIYVSALSSIKPSDFEMRAIEIVWIDKLALIESLQNTRAKHNLVIHAKEAGCVAVVPTAEQVIYGYTLRTLVLLEHYISEVLYMSSYAKTIATHTKFGETYAYALHNVHEAHVHVSQHPVHWRNLHHAIAGSPIQDVLPPHLSVDKWQSDNANQRVKVYNQMLSFWDGFGHLVTKDDERVSGSIIDLAIDVSDERAYEHRSLRYARRALEQELFSKYLQEPRILRLVMHRLDLA